MASTTTETTVSVHPLDPLSAAEIARAWEIVRTEHARGPRVRVIFVMLHEPAKKVVLQHRPGDAVERAAFVVLVDSAAGKTYEAVVSVSAGRVLSWEHVPGVQPAIVLDEFAEIEAAVRADPRWQEAMRRRGVIDTSLAMVDAWSAGNFGFPEDEGRRLVRALTWVRRHAKDNGYARPVANLLTVVDLNEMKVLSVEDGGVVPLPPEDANYTAEAAGTSVRRQADRDPPARGPELRARGPGAALAEVADAHRVHAPRGARAPHRELRGPGTRAPGPLPSLHRRHGGALRRPAPDLLPPQRLRRGRVRHRDPRQRAPERLRLPGRDPLPRRGGQRRPGSSRDAAERHLSARGGRGHPVEARGLAPGDDGGAAFAPARRVLHLHRGQLRVRLLLVLLPGRRHPARGQDDRRHLERRRARRGRSLAGASWSPPACTGRSISTSSMPAWT